MAIKPKGKKVTGTKKADKIKWTNSDAWEKALTVKAGAGNDIINFKKSKYKNNLYGDAGNDKIYGGTKNDKIYGGAGNDKLYGYAGNDVIQGGAGNDIIYGGKGNDKINAGSGTNSIYINKGDGNDIIYSGGGNDTLVFNNIVALNKIKFNKSGNDLKLVTANKDSATLKDFYKGNHSVKYLQVGNTKKNILDLMPYNEVKRNGRNYIGTNFKDYISSNTYEAVIKAYDGDDKIELLDDINEVTAGKGNDIITAYEGGAIYNFNSGDGHDTITYKKNASYNIYNFINETNISNLKLNKTKEGYKITYNNGKDSVNVKMTSSMYDLWNNYYYNKDYAKVNNQYYLISKNGLMKIYDSSLYHPSFEDTINTAKISDGVLTASNGMDYIGGVEADVVKALDGDDYISAVGAFEEESRVKIYGGKGNDTILGGGGNDIYFESGDGNDVVLSLTDHDKLIFADETSVDDMSIIKDNQGILIKYNNGSNSVKLIEDRYEAIECEIKVGNDSYIIIQDGEYRYFGGANLLGTDSDDYITYLLCNYDESDILDLRAGNDTLKLQMDDYENIAAYLNVKADGTCNNDLIIRSYDQETYSYDNGYGETESYTTTYIGGSLIVKNYLQNTSSKTIVNSNNESLSVGNELEAIKAAVAGWLSSGGYTDVADAIEQNSENLNVLLGTDYFGKFDWIQQA